MRAVESQISIPNLEELSLPSLRDRFPAVSQPSGLDAVLNLPKGKLFNVEFFGDEFEVRFTDQEIVEAASSIVERGGSLEGLATQARVLHRSIELRFGQANWLAVDPEPVGNGQYRR